MATRGRKPKPELARYYEAGAQPGIYLAEVSGMVKVGRARSLVCRLKSLHTSHRMHGQAIGRFGVFPQESQQSLYWIEVDAIHALQQVAQEVPGHREYFTGIGFDAALDVVRRALSVPA